MRVIVRSRNQNDIKALAFQFVQERLRRFAHVSILQHSPYYRTAAAVPSCFFGTFDHTELAFDVECESRDILCRIVRL